MKILLVEDDVLLLDSLTKFLKFKKYALDTATNGRDAAKVLEKNTYDVVITDLLMPHMGGIELIKMIKQNYPKIQTIAITGYLDELNKLKKEKFKPDYILTKPFKLTELVDVLESFKCKIGDRG